MSEIRAILSWDEIRTIGTTNSWHKTEYTAAIKDFTRPVTPDDVRGMIRMPEEWTGAEHRSVFCESGEFHNYRKVAQLTLDIATRPAPEKEHKRCPWCGEKPICQWHDKEVLWDVYCDNCGIGFVNRKTEAEAWAAWDKRKEGE